MATPAKHSHRAQPFPIRVAEIYSSEVGVQHALPLFLTCIPAGFPSPAESYIEKSLDLNELVVKNPAATFFVRVEGESMLDAGIFSGDILVVDRAITPANGKIIVAVINGEFTVKRMVLENNRIKLMPENANYPALEINPESDFQVWGVVTYVIHRAR